MKTALRLSSIRTASELNGILLLVLVRVLFTPADVRLSVLPTFQRLPHYEKQLSLTNFSETTPPTTAMAFRTASFAMRRMMSTSVARWQTS